jgi:hypothetical protein
VNKEEFKIPISNTAIGAFQQRLNLSDEQLESWSRLLVEEGDLIQPTDFLFYENALFILMYLNEKQKLYSFEREDLIDEIKARLNS